MLVSFKTVPIGVDVNQIYCLPMLMPSKVSTYQSQHRSKSAPVKVNNNNSNTDDLYSAVAQPKPKANALYIYSQLITVNKTKSFKPGFKNVDGW